MRHQKNSVERSSHNEVLDALPVHLMRWRGSGITERGVAVNDHNFICQERAISDIALLHAAQKISVLGDYVSEICLAARDLINSIAQRLEQGAMVFINYGSGASKLYYP